MPQSNDCDDDNYLRSCLAEVKTREQSWKFRMGGGPDLGVLRLPMDMVHQRPTQIQSSWDAPDVTNFLNGQRGCSCNLSIGQQKTCVDPQSHPAS